MWWTDYLCMLFQRLSTWDPKERHKLFGVEESVVGQPVAQEIVSSTEEDELYEVDAIREMMKDSNGKEWFFIKWAVSVMCRCVNE